MDSLKRLSVRRRGLAAHTALLFAAFLCVAVAGPSRAADVPSGYTGPNVDAQANLTSDGSLRAQGYSACPAAGPTDAGTLLGCITAVSQASNGFTDSWALAVGVQSTACATPGAPNLKIQSGDVVYCGYHGSSLTVQQVIGHQELVCSGGLGFATDPATHLFRCISSCAPVQGQAVSLSVTTTTNTAPTNACYAGVSLTCEVLPTTIAPTNFGAVFVWSGQWRYSGVTCNESANPPTLTASPPDSGGGVPPGSTAQEVALDAADKAALAGVATNTGRTADEVSTIAGLMKEDIAGDPLDCDHTPVCTGTAANCTAFAAAREGYCMNRVRDPDAAARFLADAELAVATTPQDFKASLPTKNVDVSNSFNTAGFLATASCPAPASETLHFGPIVKTFTVDFSRWCGLASTFSIFVIAGAALISARIIGKGAA